MSSIFKNRYSLLILPYAKISRVVKHPALYYVFTTFHGLNTPHFAPFCQLCDIFNNLSQKYKPRKTPQNMANQRNKGEKLQ